MSTCYYLLREDNLTVFDLDKAYTLAEKWWGDRERWDYVTVLAHDELALRAQLASWRPATAREVARRLVAFAGGQPLRLVDEHLLSDGFDGLERFRLPDGRLRVVDSLIPQDWRLMAEHGGRPLYEIWDLLEKTSP